MRDKPIRAAVLVVSFFMLALSKSLAETLPPNRVLQEDKEIYSIEYFTQYTPQTALDIVQHIPGFILDPGDDIRGFGAGAGNVLIDSTRPSSKSGGVEEALRRIPAAQVLKVEVIRGAVSTGEAAGQSVIANVIRVKHADAKLWQFELERAADGFLYPNVDMTFAQMVGAWKSSFKTNAYWERFPREAVIENRDGDGMLLSSQTEDRPSRLGEAFISADAHRDIGMGTLQLNGRLAWSRWVPDTDRLGFTGRLPDDLPDERFSNHRDSEYYTGEIGVDWTRAYPSNWTWRLLGVSTGRNWWVNATTEEEVPVGQFDKGSVFRFDEHISETILRTTFAKSGDEVLRPEYGLEMAYNRLDSRLGFHAMDQMNRSLSMLRATHALVDELRAEAFTNILWKVREKLTLEAGMAVESSHISVSGDAENSDSLFYWKPSIALIYNKTHATQYRFNLRRTIGQLDFSDFAAEADLIDNRQIAGNPKLQPDQTVRSSLSVDHRFAERGAINVELFYEWRKDVLEQIILPSGDQGIGNAGDARVWGIKSSLSLPLESILQGGLLEIEVDSTRSRFEDPITGESRDLTDITRPRIQVDVRQDIIAAKMSWGVTYQSRRTANSYFINEHHRSVFEPLGSAFIETTRFEDIKVRLSLRNLGEEREHRQRWIYAQDRSGALALFEDTHRTTGPFVALTISGRF